MVSGVHKFWGDLLSQLTSIKQGEVVVALGRGRGFIMMVGKWGLVVLACLWHLSLPY